MRLILINTLTVIILVLFISGCTSGQLYAIGQDSQRSLCFKIPDQKESNECLNRASMSYDEYKSIIQEQGK